MFLGELASSVVLIRGWGHTIGVCEPAAPYPGRFLKIILSYLVYIRYSFSAAVDSSNGRCKFLVSCVDFGFWTRDVA